MIISQVIISKESSILTWSYLWVSALQRGSAKPLNMNILYQNEC